MIIPNLHSPKTPFASMQDYIDRLDEKNITKAKQSFAKAKSKRKAKSKSKKK